MSMPGCQWGFIELRCSLRSLRALGQFRQASGHLHVDQSHSDYDRYHREDNGRITLGACPGDQANYPEAIQ